MKQPAYIDVMENWREEFTFFHARTVRFSDLDMFGHLNNTKVFSFFEDARLEFLKEAGFMTGWMNQQSEQIIVTADLQADYLRQVYFDEQLRVGVKVAGVGSSSLDLHYVILNGRNDMCVTGRGAIVQINSKTGSAEPLEEEQRRHLLKISSFS
ncbi:acyl-CoA thioesterase [Salisediminibacterium halotolerans]|uniref:Acyl-CoA thioester hydrolase n=1 Tax=Salisediminibacterium halotolerans TaxID=517425 RepID=A0A1H9U1Z4_9BACI|nr:MULTISPECIES: thioesterase family protein [Salisediminibacterium]RLJ81117.1 acyl-CoA thioester hydrolase [Actinophytocola xinjiangensis]RPE84074.1 acyl-CoA thioester hydrolase [Salisediminibacterium halotolerans]TWG38544.1 acyl-CoA thioester hydrolase [Salisediminibacterium halotolerans]SES03515.1 acyl-CoA thioester hydrolase [Salisediminibacterium haloalkalitolerans]GEL07180.1 hypothetical protein SHA02_05960 [Salisediminibacterium halotolerans]